jgi:predicted amidophosphoribosyltransferase
MRQSKLLPRLEYGSLLSYAPRGDTSEIRHSREVMWKLKSDGFLANPRILISQWVARTVQQNKNNLEFGSFFHSEVILVPVPKSSLMQRGTLWVPERLATALVHFGLGKRVASMLERVKPVRKAAWSSPEERLLPAEHYDSLNVQKSISEPKGILLVDDIVTRGATLLAAATRLAEVYPRCTIRAFAAMRTISDPLDFSREYQPVRGEIVYRPEYGDTVRRP